MEMTQSNRFPYHYCKYNQNLPRLDQASLNPTYPQDRQEDTNKEEPISQFIFPTTTHEYEFHSDDELVPSIDIVGCSTNHCCRIRSSNTETSDYNDHEIEQLQESSPRSFLGLIDVPTNLDDGLNFVDFELFDSQWEQCEELHDIWLDPSTSSNSSKLHLDDEQSCKSFDTFDTPRSSEMSLYHGDFCSPPPNSATSSWIMSNESMTLLPTIYPGDYVEASNSDLVVGIGQWMCGTRVKSNDLEDEPKILRNTDNNTTSRTNKAIEEILDSFELVFYGVE
ncbi:uncharacterized protein Bfra_008241 [Botrytis fragariae]|uniref:Uncharacterized protein n=1 Tax=Botrytis fragariae TaxID=1964551 RepID=A0A8H6ASQ5_9HELO|nr:uncharacterized protein Bfra_008241 [Botrytis fragariae]KAF5872964.1 hypothetical protein Bfra_008241 [Botrytis fragariae]